MKKVLSLIIIMLGYGLTQEGARYLIITHDNFYSAIQPLAEWKNQKGMKAKVVRLSETGSTNTQIRNYILNAYNTWNPRPEFILLVGSVEYLPSYNRTYYATDNEYANMSGDYQAELCYGRFPAKTPAQCSIMVAKTLNYERMPYLGDTLWFRAGTVIVNQDNDPDDTIYWNNVRFAASQMIAKGYTRIDTFCDAYGHSASNVVSAVNSGRTFVLYRGSATDNWYTPFAVNPNLTTNGNKLPVICSFTCATMTLFVGESMVGDAWIKSGTTSNLKGAVAFVGNTHSGVNIAPVRGAMTIGFFTKAFAESCWNLGGAVLAGKKQIYTQFANQYEYEGFNLLGDPELCLWTGLPKPLTVTYPTNIPMQAQNFTVTVNQQDLPVPNALVCVMKGTEIYAYGYTNSQGQVTLAINPTSLGTMLITVTARNCLPYEGSAQVVPSSGSFPIYFGHIIIDPSPQGNNDGSLNPGEAIRLRVGLKNIGDIVSRNVWATLRSSEPQVQISDSVQYYGDILPDSIVFSPVGFALQVAPACTNEQVLNFNLFIQDSAGNYPQNFSLVVYAGKIRYQGYNIADPMPGGNGNGRLDPGESGKLFLTINNQGEAGLLDVHMRLQSSDPAILITDSTGHFGPLNPGETKTNTDDPFALSISPNVFSGYRANLLVQEIGLGGTYEITDSLVLILNIGESSQNVPTGPDAYGYFVYDNTDANSGQAPTYNWIEISSIGQTISGITNANDAIVTLNLPFTFRYYGQDYNTISASSNGYLVMGSSTFNSGENTPIFSACPNLIAPFWDDLDMRQQMQGYGDAYQYFDATNHRYIIEYRQAAHYGNRQIQETFQAIFLDPAYYSTPTGDGEIIFQYQIVANASSNTVGFCDNTRTRGLQLLFNGEYDPSVAGLTSNRAYRITTVPPQAIPAPWLSLVTMEISDSLGNGNGLAEPGENITLSLTIENFGQVSANDITSILRTSDADAIMIDSLADFGSLEPGSQANNNPLYQIQIVANPQDSIANFALALTANNGNYNTLIYFSLNLYGVISIKESSKFALISKSIPEIECLPNPFTKSTVIRFSNPSVLTAHSELKIYNLTGKLVKSFKMVSGRHNAVSELVWDGKDKAGKEVPKGLYFIILYDNKNWITINQKLIRTN